MGLYLIHKVMYTPSYEIKTKKYISVYTLNNITCKYTHTKNLPKTYKRPYHKYYKLITRISF